MKYIYRLWAVTINNKYGQGIKGDIFYILSPPAIIYAIAILPSFIILLREGLYTHLGLLS